MSLRTYEPRRVLLHIPRSVGERSADAVTSFAGSWWFVLLHVVWFGVWMTAIEPDPWPRLTLIVSLEAIFLATLVMISQNRQAAKDRQMAARDDEEIGLLVDLQREQMLAHRFERKALSALLGRTPIALAEMDLEALRSLVDREKRRIASSRELAGEVNPHYDHAAPTVS